MPTTQKQVEPKAADTATLTAVPVESTPSVAVKPKRKFPRTTVLSIVAGMLVFAGGFAAGYLTGHQRSAARGTFPSDQSMPRSGQPPQGTFKPSERDDDTTQNDSKNKSDSSTDTQEN